MLSYASLRVLLPTEKDAQVKHEEVPAGRVLVASFLLVVAPQLLQAQEIPYEFEPPELIVAIGDVHGDYDGFVDNLMATEFLDRTYVGLEVRHI